MLSVREMCSENLKEFPALLQILIQDACNVWGPWLFFPRKMVRLVNDFMMFSELGKQVRRHDWVGYGVYILQGVCIALHEFFIWTHLHTTEENFIVTLHHHGKSNQKFRVGIQAAPAGPGQALACRRRPPRCAAHATPSRLLPRLARQLLHSFCT